MLKSCKDVIRIGHEVRETPVFQMAVKQETLTYTFSEGTTLEGLTQKSSKLGDGKAWTPNVTVKGGTSGFYSIGVRK